MNKKGHLILDGLFYCLVEAAVVSFTNEGHT